MSHTPSAFPAKVTVRDFARKKAAGEKIAVLTAYDFTTAQIVDYSGVDAILVGDSLGMVVQGKESTVPVTLDEMIYHTRCVSRGRERALLIADMPFGSYQVSVEDAKRSVVRMMQEGLAEAVKLEGGVEMADTIRAVVRMGVPVCAHIGLTPQSVHAFGGYHVQGRGDAAAKLAEDARAVADAGAFAVVLEKVPGALAEEITRALPIPTIGIGAGAATDGQVLVVHDMLGLFDGFVPKFVKRYAHLKDDAAKAVERYVEEVRAGAFPGPEHTFK